jgi:L-malate glycosyltransferase
MSTGIPVGGFAQGGFPGCLNMDDAFSINAGEIDVDGIKDSIRRSVEKKKQQGCFTPEEERRLQESFGRPDPSDDGSFDRYRRPISRGRDTAGHSYWISSYRPLIGRVIVAVRKLVNGGVKRYVDPTTARQQEFNRDAAGAPGSPGRHIDEKLEARRSVMKGEVHQLLSALTDHDAVGNDTLEIRKMLRERGYRSDIYTEHFSPGQKSYRKPFSSLARDNERAVLLYHFSLYSDLPARIKDFPGKKVLIYHNVTPPEFFRPYDEDLYRLCEAGRRQLGELRDMFDLALGVSDYNRRELEALGFRNTGVLPILVDLDKYDRYDRAACAALRDGHTNLLFVGRLAPNKKQEDLVIIFYYYHKYINPRSRLYIVGNDQVRGYAQKLKRLVADAGLEGSVLFTGEVSDRDLSLYYRAADVFLCMSEHEGFCVPLVEAMHFSIPIIAYDCTGISSTMGPSGILVRKKDYATIAGIIGAVMDRADLREGIVRQQRIRLGEFEREKIADRLDGMINDLQV